jgi:short subunit dehydrogenase-like uncharacterized protein
MADRPLAMLGATGYTGQFVLGHARTLGFPVRLVGRRREALEELARNATGYPWRIPGTPPRSPRPSKASCGRILPRAVPQARPRPGREAIAAGAHYLDTTGEQPLARLIHEELGTRAVEAGVAVFLSFGFDYVPGDLAARLAAEGLEPLDEVIAAYLISNASPSAGTLKTMAQLGGSHRLRGRTAGSSNRASARRSGRSGSQSASAVLSNGWARSR